MPKTMIEAVYLHIIQIAMERGQKKLNMVA